MCGASLDRVGMSVCRSRVWSGDISPLFVARCLGYILYRVITWCDVYRLPFAVVSRLSQWRSSLGRPPHARRSSGAKWQTIVVASNKGIRCFAGIAQSVWRLATGWTVRGERVPVEARFSAPVRTGPGTHPASYTMSTGSFPGVKRPGRDVDQPPTSSAEVKERV